MGSSVKSDNFTASTHRSHAHTTLSGDENQYLHGLVFCTIHAHSHQFSTKLNNVNFTAHLMRVGSSAKSDNFTAYDTPIKHLQHCPVTRTNIFGGHHVPICICTASPQAIPSGRVGPIAPVQDPNFDKYHADTLRGMWWPHKVLIIVAGQCVCVWSGCLSCAIATFSTWPALIKCAVKLTLFVQFR